MPRFRVHNCNRALIAIGRIGVSAVIPRVTAVAVSAGSVAVVTVSAVISWITVSVGGGWIAVSSVVRAVSTVIPVGTSEAEANAY